MTKVLYCTIVVILHPMMLYRVKQCYSERRTFLPWDFHFGGFWWTFNSKGYFNENSIFFRSQGKEVVNSEFKL